MRNTKGPKRTRYLPLEICTLPKDSLQFRASDNSACRPLLRADTCGVRNRRSVKNHLPTELPRGGAGRGRARCLHCGCGRGRAPRRGRTTWPPRRRCSCTTWSGTGRTSPPRCTRPWGAPSAGAPPWRSGGNLRKGTSPQLLFGCLGKRFSQHRNTGICHLNTETSPIQGWTWS